MDTGFQCIRNSEVKSEFCWEHMDFENFLNIFSKVAEEKLNNLIRKNFKNKNYHEIFYVDDISSTIDKLYEEEKIQSLSDIKDKNFPMLVLQERLKSVDEDAELDIDSDEEPYEIDQEWIDEQKEFRNKMNLIPEAIKETIKDIMENN
jgi:hypothetical protein